MTKVIKKAVSIIFVCDKKIFVIKRQNFLRAFPGYTAFPGGKVDAEDKVENLEATLLNAVKREIFEELAYKIKENQEIKKIAKATSPPFNPYCFETYFYLIKIATKESFAVDKNEVQEFCWITPIELLEQFNTGNRLMVGPVKEIVESLTQDINGLDFKDFDRAPPQLPQIEPFKGLLQILPKSNTIFPATRTNAFVIGEEKKVLIDPSPKDVSERDLFIKEIKNHSIEKIIITHHHGDHHQFSTDIARHFNIPIALSSDSFERIKKVFKDDYFIAVEVIILQEGDSICRWQGEDVITHHIPGHDEGHLGFAPRSLRWFIAGDLFQGVGTVVVGGEESCMTKYMQSLRKVIDLAPESVIPSHGIALGGTNILQKTYDHRLLREKQILELTKKRYSVDQILKNIYFGIPKSVHKYAKANIQSHLLKLKKENKI
ncbi:MAG: MBL fold metallo-hydrolase [Halobacteriovoraceae bacterium]|jgi:endoribonuclease LACTB2|nr:MBL fold metallo-hydrolase [Halobacteriovoraceae bacterium]